MFAEAFYETDLITRAQAGDDGAFGEIQLLLEPQIGRFVRRLVGDSDTADIVQDVFLALYKNLDSVHPPEKLRPFLYRVARNRCYDELRRRGRFDQVTLDDEPMAEWVSWEFAEAIPPEDLTHWLMLNLEVQEAMQQLPEVQRQALILYSEEEMTYTEIAEIMNTSVGTAKSRVHYARKALRKMLRPEILEILDSEFQEER
jgi:RNA polymerase sigma-70 factor, ECF subfamily